MLIVFCFVVCVCLFVCLVVFFCLLVVLFWFCFVGAVVGSKTRFRRFPESIEKTGPRMPFPIYLGLSGLLGPFWAPKPGFEDPPEVSRKLAPGGRFGAILASRGSWGRFGVQNQGLKTHPGLIFDGFYEGRL